MEGTEQLAPDVWMASSESGRVFDEAPTELRGQHGSLRCRTQLAMVSGGDPMVGSISRRIQRTFPSVLDWAPMVVGLLGIVRVAA
ncbi:MAG: hypothetical protein ACR2O6_15570 [Ilumatobacteraceae bacterium]